VVDDQQSRHCQSPGLIARLSGQIPPDLDAPKNAFHRRAVIYAHVTDDRRLPSAYARGEMTEMAGSEASLQQSRENTVLAHLEAENRQDVPATLATFKPGAARTELPGEVADGHDAVAATYREFFTALPDIHFDFEDGSLCHHGDLVICETRAHGTHLGPFRGLPPTGRRVDLPIVAVFQFDGPTLSVNAPISIA
jgi:predicted ester cyclase